MDLVRDKWSQSFLRIYNTKVIRELYLWAATVMTTRSFVGPASFNRTEGDSVVAGDGDGRCPVLIPGLDILNHDPSAKVSWVWDTNVCALRLNESIAGGCQVWNNYDPKSNEERGLAPVTPEMLLTNDLLVIMGYGFSIPENPSDHYSLGFSPAIVTYIKATKARRLAFKPSCDAVHNQSNRETSDIPQKLVQGIVRSGGQVLESSEDLNVEKILDQNIHWVRLLEDEEYRFSPHFLEDFSIAVENRREKHIADASSGSVTNFSHRDFSRNKLHVICAVIMILQKGQRAIRKHDKDLPEAPQNSKQVDAARYRDSQLRILDSVLSSMCTFLKSVTTASSPEAGDPRVVRLEHTLTHLPKSLLKDLRGVLNAGVRTREPVRIRERGGVDFAFTTWLCGLWVYSQSDRRGEDEINPRYLRWLHFLQKHYAEPSEEYIDRQKPDNPVPEASAEWFDPVRSASGDGALDSTLIARSYLDAVQVATEKRPQSVYKDGRITVRRLEWCLNIVKNEGVWCPNVDQGEDEEHDEWVLFLELGDSSGFD